MSYIYIRYICICYTSCEVLKGLIEVEEAAHERLHALAGGVQLGSPHHGMPLLLVDHDLVALAPGQPLLPVGVLPPY